MEEGENGQAREAVVISVGGSLIVPDNINREFVKRFKEVVGRQVDAGKRFIIIAGGGHTARNYQAIAREFKELSSEDIDWIGINATRLNANFLRIILDELAGSEIVIDPTQNIENDKPVIIAGGWQPGASTDYVAVLIAQKLGAKKMINLTNIDYIYDPRRAEETGVLQPITDIEWKAFRDMIPGEWNPGLNAPFDPVASRLAEEIGLEVASINGQILEELEKYLRGEEFRGTRIH